MTNYELQDFLNGKSQHTLDLFHHFVLPYDYFANFTNYAAMRLLEAVNPFL